MSYNISTNIVRDENKELNYVVTPNAEKIFDRIFSNNAKTANSFMLIGNYGTGKSTFLWALEKTVNQQHIFFNNVDFKDNSFSFIKLIGDNKSFKISLAKTLKMSLDSSSEDLLAELENIYQRSIKKGKGLVLIVDEFGKFIEYINKHQNYEDLYLLQLIAEWINDADKKSYFIISLHQSFSAYAANISIEHKQEWEKIKGRFVELPFNEPIEQLLFFASKQLNDFELPNSLINSFNLLNKLIKQANLVPFSNNSEQNLVKSLYPLDWLSANVLVNALQRYGQNERSLFTFLNDDSKYSIHKSASYFYTVSNVFDYIVNSLASEINGITNPHRAQWQSAFRALERAELFFEENYNLVEEIIKTICLVNVFSKAGGLFDEEFIKKYFKRTRNIEIHEELEALFKSGIIRFYKHSNKINFLEGTDIDIEQELAAVTKEINHDFSVAEEIHSLVNFPIVLAKKHSFEKGTPRFFEFKILGNLKEVTQATGSLDGYVNLIFDKNIKTSEIKSTSINSGSNLFVLYKNSSEINKQILTIKKFELLIGMHTEDRNAVKLLDEELLFHKQQLEIMVLDNLYNASNEHFWCYNGIELSIKSKNALNEKLSKICNEIFYKTPVFINELVNKEFLSPQINTARKYLIRRVLENSAQEDLDFETTKFPPEKAIYISLLKQTEVHKKEGNFDYYSLSAPSESSKFNNLWNDCSEFISSAQSAKKNLNDLYEMLSKPPYKLKKGFIDFWIPIFLIAKKEDYALFHVNSGFIPYISDEITDLIYKVPSNFYIKSYDVSGLKINLLESYKKLVHLENNALGTKSTFLSIYGNFLLFYRGLNEYTLQTKSLKEKTRNLREAIKNAKDPEDALFNQFPAALDFPNITLKDDSKLLSLYIDHINTSVDEIRNAYSVLIDNIEKILIKAFYCQHKEFELYKNEIQNKLIGIDSNLLGSNQAIFYKRIQSPLSDRSSWLKSLADVALGKSIDKMVDEEMGSLTGNLEDLALALIKSVEIHQFNKSSENQKMYSFKLFTPTGAIIENKIISNKNYNGSYQEVKKHLEGKLQGLDLDERQQLLLELLTNQLENVVG